MKLAACYTVFNGTELLERSMNAIANHVDFFVICWQMFSVTGEAIKHPDLENINILKDRQNVHVIQFNRNNSIPSIMNSKEVERLKHNFMIQAARELGATHFLMAACDHFYDPVEFEYCKRLVEAMDYDSTFTAMYTYYKFPTWQLTPIESYYMPFICKLQASTRIEKVSGFPLRVDPSVQMNPLGKWYTFKEFEIMMHHYSMVRCDIGSKFKNSPSAYRWQPGQKEAFTEEWNNYDIDKNPGVKYFHGRKIKIVRDYFNLNHIFEP